MIMDAERKVAVVTGASRGIGKGIALELSKRGYDLVLLSRNTEQLEVVKVLCEENNISSACIAVDFSDIKSIEASVSLIQSHHTDIDVVIISHGEHVRGELAQVDGDSVKTMIETNLVGSVYFVQKIVPIITSKKSSELKKAIIFINSMAAHADIAGSAGYVASKKGLLGFAGSLFEEIRESGVKVSSICPGYVNSRDKNYFHADTERMLQIDDIVKCIGFVLDSSDTSCPIEIKLRPQRSPIKES